MFEVRIETDNAAFDGDAAGEVARILRELADTLEDWSYGKSGLYDINGNKVGSWTLTHVEEN